MNNGIVQMNLLQFSFIYLLLLVVLFVMKRAQINQTKLLFVASIRMSVQLVIAGLVLTVIFEQPKAIFTVGYVLLMIGFSIARIFKKCPNLSRKFQLSVGLSIGLSGTFVLVYFVVAVVGESIFNPQYAIPLAGMIIGNAMTGVILAIKSFEEKIALQKDAISSLLNLGVHPKEILRPYVNQSLEMAILPTLNTMVGMGIVSLPGMMTGQILSGTLPMTAIMYQIAIMIAITTSVCLSVFFSLFFGYKTLYNDEYQILFEEGS